MEGTGASCPSPSVTARPSTHARQGQGHSPAAHARGEGRGGEGCGGVRRGGEGAGRGGSALFTGTFGGTTSEKLLPRTARRGCPLESRVTHLPTAVARSWDAVWPPRARSVQARASGPGRRPPHAHVGTDGPEGRTPRAAGCSPTYALTEVSPLLHRAERPPRLATRGRQGQTFQS